MTGWCVRAGAARRVGSDNVVARRFSTEDPVHSNRRAPLPDSSCSAMAYDGDCDDADDEGMDDPVILRGLLQCCSIFAFFTVRYVLDVLLTVPVVQAMSHRAVRILHGGWNAACCAPLASVALLYLTGSLDSGWLGLFARVLLRTCILRALFATLLDDSVVVFSLRKRHIWVPLGWLVTFTRVSSGRMAPQGIWRGGYHRFLCRAMPWVLRAYLFWATWPTPFTSRSYAVFEASTPHAPFDRPNPDGYAPPSPPEMCSSYTGFQVPCEELERVRAFNSRIMPTMRDANYRAIRKAMNDHGFAAHIWHVGHAIPDSSKKSTRNEEDFGWNLFAQHAVDNLKLGHCLVSCAEARHMGAHHVQCSASKDCVQSLSRTNGRWW